MILIAIDPSSTCCGLAVFKMNGSVSCLVEMFRVTPESRGDDANTRIADMAFRIEKIVIRHRGHGPAPYEEINCVIEDTSGRVGARHGGGGAGLAIYGKSIGWIASTVTEIVGSEHTHLIPENKWTRGKPKAARAANCKLIYPQYDSVADPGMDLADAIMLGEWWIQEHRMHKLLASR